MAINKEELLFKKVFAGKASTDNSTAYFSETAITDARLSVFSKDVWSEAHLIPDSGIGHITGSVSPGNFTASGVVKYYSASGFTAVAGADAGYSAGIKDWIPFNFGDGVTYNYVLLKNNGERLFPGTAASNWTFDTEAGVLIFHDGNPSGVSAAAPPSMSAYVYTGKKLSEGLTDGLNLISSSAQIIANLPTDTVSSSAQIKTNLPTDTVSSSAQVVLNSADKTGFDTDDVSEGSTNLYYTDTRVKTKLDAEGIISGSAQVTLGSDNISEGSTNLYYTDTRVKTKLDAEGVISGSGFLKNDSNIISSSTQIDNLGFLKNEGDSVVSSSAQIDTLGFLKNKGDSVVSSSAQINSLINDTIAATIVAEIDNDEIPIAKLSADSITIGGASATLLGNSAAISDILKGSGTISSSLHKFTNITASGDISASGDLFANEITLKGVGAGIQIESDSATEIQSTGTDSFNISSVGDLFLLAGSGKELRFGSDNTNDHVRINKGHVTASGNISASGDIFSKNLTVSNSITTENLTIGGIQFENVISTEITSTTTNFSGSIRIGSGSSADTIDPITNAHQITGSIEITGSGIFPNVSGTIDLGSATQKFTNLFATNTFFGGVHEINLETKGLDKMQEGTVLTLKNGTLHPCEKEADALVMGIVSSNSNFPIILGAEPILVTGKIKEGDYIITSNIKGHGKGVAPKYIYTKQLFGKIIAQAIENGNGRSHIIKAMIRKM